MIEKILLSLFVTLVLVTPVVGMSVFLHMLISYDENQKKLKLMSSEEQNPLEAK
jgi:hypothetical protein